MNGSSLILPDREWRRESSAELAAFLSRQFAPPAAIPMTEWWERNIYVPDGEFPGEFRLDLTPMMRWVADWLQDPTVKRIVLQGSAQSFKTRCLLNFLLWAIGENPGTAMWVNATIEAAREFYLKRLEPAIENCLPVKERFEGRTKDLIAFDSMNLLLRGTNSRVGMQGDPVKWMIFDERREWKPGAIAMLRMRTRTMTEYKEISAGTAGLEGSELDVDFREGSQTQAHFRCADCGESQPFRFGKAPSALFPNARDKGGLVAVDAEGRVVGFDNEWTKPNGVWHWERLRQAVRFQCQKCGRLYANQEKHELLKTIHPVDYNPAAPADVRSFTWNALPFLWKGCDWGLLAEMFLKAVDSARNVDGRDIEPLKTFVTETLGESWSEEQGAIEDWGFLEDRREDYEFGQVWPEETIRFMAADRQAKGGEHYWYVIRAWGRFGKSRLVSYGRCNTLSELEEVRKAHGVLTCNSMMDSGFQAPEVYRFCLATGWKAFKGSDAEYFVDPQTHARRIWQKSKVDPYMGESGGGRTMIPLYQWSNPTTKDLLAEYMQGLVGGWSVPRKVGKDYFMQVTANVRTERRDTRGRIFHVWKTIRRDDHLADCELMGLVAAVINKVAAVRGVQVTTESAASLDAKPG